MSPRVLCIDLGASSGRAMLAELRDGKIVLTEVRRFKNRGIPVRGTLYWDILALYSEIRASLADAHHAGGFDSVGIDSWGVDYGMIGKSGDIMGFPMQYRDSRTAGMSLRSRELIAPEKLYALTGNQIMDINTAFQLMAEKQRRPYMLDNGTAMLNIPDLLGYMLTGAVSSEVSIASTTQLFDPACMTWSDEAISAFGLPRRIFPDIIKTGDIKGLLDPELCAELDIPQRPVIAVCGHDTQCASFAAPAEGEDYAFLSSGTWSLFGTILEKPVLTPLAAQLDLTNEVGYGGCVNLLKNITGLWLVQETREFLHSRGEEHTFAQLEEMARAESDFTAFIDPDDPLFGTAGDMPKRVKEYCEMTGQTVPKTLGQVMRVICISLAMKYRFALDQIRQLTGRKIPRIYAVGGGTRDTLLCQLTADVCGVPVTAGPVEATVMGNAAMQFLQSGAIADRSDIPQIIAASEQCAEYIPKKNYEEDYIRFSSVITKK